MAISFEVTADRLTITQTRRGLRIAMWVFVGFGVLGAVVMNRSPDRHVTLACERAGGQCTVTHGSGGARRFAFAAITGVRLTEEELVLERTGLPAYHLCHAPRTELTGIADQLARFVKDPAAPSLAVTCDSTLDVGVPLAGRIAGIAGLIVTLFAMGMFLVETRVVIDRSAGTIAMRGSKWPGRTWAIERTLRQVGEVWVKQVYVGRGQRAPLVHVRFTDGTSVLAFSPAAIRYATLDARVAELRRFVGAS